VRNFNDTVIIRRFKIEYYCEVDFLSLAVRDTLESSIEKYINSTKNKQERDKRSKILSEGLLRHVKRRLTVEMLNRKEIQVELSGYIFDTLSSFKIGKQSAFLTIMKYLKFLNDRYELNIDPKKCLIDMKPSNDKRERQINLLKELHEPKSRTEIVNTYCINERTLRTDLSELEKGIEFLGSNIKIDIDSSKGNISYKSTVHPIFLPLNLTEAYSMTVGLKKLSRDNFYGSILDDMADYIYSQLSDYAKESINKTLVCQDLKERIYFDNEYTNSFRDEKTMFEKKREHRMVYHEKRMGSYRKGVDIVFQDKDEIKTIKGARLYTVGGGNITIEHGDDQERIKIRYEQIISVESSESEHGKITNYSRSR
jgi:hypothetical protein